MASCVVFINETALVSVGGQTHETSRTYNGTFLFTLPYNDFSNLGDQEVN